MTIDPREIVIGLVALIGLYLVYAVVRLRRLSKARRAPVVQPEYQTVLAPETPPPTEPNLGLSDWREPREQAARKPENEAFDALVELARLRFQIESIETSQVALREELDAVRSELESLRNARNVAPQYGEAVSLAQRGLDSAAIAESCGISVSEAELVAALARGARKQE